MPIDLDIPASRARRRTSGAFMVALASAVLAVPAQAQRGVADSATAGLRSAGQSKPFAALSATALSMRDSLVKMARAQVGARYVLGGTAPERGFDCSGLVRYVMSTFRLDLPRTAARQAKAGTSVGMDTAQLRPGDLLAFGRGKGAASHVGIYVGDGRYVHASSVAGRVIESALERPKSPRVRKWRDTRRVIVAEADSGQ
jgi:cell wall-associated NlpC family hydrolase